MHQSDDAGSTPHVALHVLHAPGRLDGNAARIETNALADKGHRLLTALAAVPAHDHGAGWLGRALGDAEQRAHSELFHGLDVENLDLDSELAQLRGAAREFDGEQHVRGLVHQIARHQHAVYDVGARRKGLSRRTDVIDGERNLAAQGGVFAILLFGLVTVEFICAQPYAGGDRGGLLRLHRAVGQFRHDRYGAIARTQFAGRCAAELEEILFLDVRELAGADHDQTRGLEPLRGQDIEHGPALALELVRLRRALDQVRGVAQRLAGRRAQLQRIVAKDHQSAPWSGGKRYEADLDGVGHRQIPPKSGAVAGRRPTGRGAGNALVGSD